MPGGKEKDRLENRTDDLIEQVKLVAGAGFNRWHKTGWPASFFDFGKVEYAKQLAA